jgi:cytochrome oxidase Cu insertion factor (SCO1/SenC/PrrC family)
MSQQNHSITPHAKDTDSGRAPLPKLVWVGLVGAPAAVAILALQSLSGSGAQVAQAAPLAVIGGVPDFSFTERDGRPIGRRDLLGKVWLANFFFARCAGPCPELSLRMRSIQKSLLERGTDATLVSFTLDPNNDTLAALGKYAKKYDADPNRWWFLTGPDEDVVHRFVKEGLSQAVHRSAGSGEIIHSTYFMLVDQQGQIRGVYEGLDPSSKPNILTDIDRLLSEPTAS